MESGRRNQSSYSRPLREEPRPLKSPEPYPRRHSHDFFPESLNAEGSSIRLGVELFNVIQMQRDQGREEAAAVFRVDDIGGKIDAEILGDRLII